jgi:ABC-type nickel/cobalt efflux system permease component RcnA
MTELPRLDYLLGGVIAVLIMLTGFSIHHLSIGAVISKRTKFNALACSRCLRWKCLLPDTAKCVHGG